MKKIYTTLALFFIGIISYSQTDGMSYQAVIIDNNPQEIPGVDVASNGLPNKELNIRFTILGDGETIEYQETHQTETDAFGMINLMIGLGTITTESPGAFNIIYWTNNKFLRVEINLQDGNGYIPFSYQELTYIPYAKHREIIATATLDVDGATNLNSSFFVNNQSPSLLTGDLTVLGTAFFSDGVFENLTVIEHSQLNTLTANGRTNINNSFNVNDASPTALTGNLTVDGISNFNNRIRINADLDEDDEDDYEAYPLQVAGNSQGIAVKLNANDPNRSNNYMSFWSNNGIARGRIEGNNYLEPISRDFVLDLITPPDFGDLVDIGNGEPIPTVFANDYFNNDYAFGAYHYTIDFTFSILRFGINLTAAGGLCVVGDCDDAIWSFIDLTVDGIQLAEYILYNEMSIGVAFESGSADYAEWLKKYDENEFLSFGDVVGVRGGLISKSFVNAENYMVVSQNPLISGAMPQKDEEYLFERIAFMGQVPVKVIGKANKGDYIIPTGNGDGMAIAVSPQNMKINDYQRIIGVAWQVSNGDKLFSYINTAVGINNNDMAGVISQMQQVMNQMQLSIIKLDKNYKPNLFDTSGVLTNDSNEKTTTLDVKAQLAGNAIKNKERLQHMLKDTKTRFEAHKFDFSKFPHLMETLENPTLENGQKLVDHYAKVLERLQKIKPTKR
ncbi:MAG: hypothetical protein NWP87_05060 [Winogradskyella sp.]|nr:hypothetical protein [Winogradskyella sp.]